MRSRRESVTDDVGVLVAPRLTAPPFRALSQYAAQAIREGIVTGRFTPGSRLIERDLATELAVSRVPVREALLLLAREGFVIVEPHRGAVVTAVSPDLVVDVFSVRTELEVMAARLATPKVSSQDLARLERLVEEMSGVGSASGHHLLVDQDIEFHRVLARSCERPVLLEALAVIWNKTWLLISVSRAAYPLERIASLHADLLQAVVSRNPDRIEVELRHHMTLGQEVLLEHLRGVHPDREGGLVEATLVTP